ncbi:Ig-like domain repeat protein [Nocardioides sp. 503]|uniref:Ig-like domain repeat protein n=1 Tax=Nocardioides sp. 503 TaxID=2508326 RepID=UPI00106F71DF|nr:Ig-like domain repeat protein [Nocardioides sp. 503]
MKKLIAGLFTAILTTAGFVAVTSATPASAACTSYVCIPTATKATPAPKTIKAGKAAKVKVAVTVRGNATVRGSVTVTATGPGGFRKTFRLAYNNRPVTGSLGKLRKPGKYKVTATYTGVEGFRNSTGKSVITVKKKKR